MKKKTLIIWILLFLTLSQYVAGKNFIEWDTKKIELTIGNGLEETEDIIVSFTSKVPIENVDLWIVPELQNLVKTEPDHFKVIEKNTIYELKLHFTIPPSTPEGIYYGTIHLRSGHRTYPQTLKIEINIDYENNIITPLTKVLSESSTQYLSSVLPDGSQLTFSQPTTELKSLCPGDILAIGITDTTPYGLLRKVESVSSNGNFIVNTVHSTLEEAIYSGTLNLFKALTPEDVAVFTSLKQGVTLQNIFRPQALGVFYFNIDNVILFDFDSNPLTTYDQIRANGNISFETSFDFKIKIDDLQLKYLSFINTSSEKAEIEIDAEISVLSLEKKVEIAQLSFAPITVWVGWLPVIITPVLSVNVGLDGDVSVDVDTSIIQEATLEAGLTFDDGIWAPISDFSNGFQFSPPRLSASCDFRGYAGPQLNLFVYGVVGPYAEINGLLEISTSFLGKLMWELFGGLDAGIGVKFEIFSMTITDYYAKVIEYKLLLAQGEIGAPPGENLVFNPSFEEGTGTWPDGWEIIDPNNDATFIWSNTIAHTSSHAVGIINCTKARAWTAWITTDFIPVNPNNEYELSGWCFWSEEPHYRELALITIWPYDAYGNQQPGSANAFPVRVGSWQYYEIYKPEQFLFPNTAKVKISVARYYEISTNSNAYLWFDDVKFAEKR